MSPIPRFEQEFLESVAFAYRKRQKAIRHQASHAACAKVYEADGREQRERLEIDLVKYDRASLRLRAGADRSIWLDARRREKIGPVWSWTFEGRLLGERSARDVIEALEKSFALLFEMDATRTATLEGPWTPMLARGPRACR